jgi:hypothetical protein
MLVGTFKVYLQRIDPEVPYTKGPCDENSIAKSLGQQI